MTAGVFASFGSLFVGFTPFEVGNMLLLAFLMSEDSDGAIGKAEICQQNPQKANVNEPCKAITTIDPLWHGQDRERRMVRFTG
jgi:hypothetical protein